MNMFLEMRKDVFYSGRIYTKLMQSIYDYNLIEELNSGQI